MIFKPSSSSISKQFNECYPVAISEYKNDSLLEESLSSFNQSLDDAFQHLEKERLAALFKILTRTLNQVIYRCSKVLELGPQIMMDLPTPTLENILNQMVLLAEREPYGVRGGTLVVMFSPLPALSNTAPIKIGRFQLDPTTVSTYELHLTLQPSNQLKLKLANLVRRLQGKAAKLVVDEKFSLVKKKLYRSSTSL